MSKYPVWTMRLSDETKARWSEYAEAEQLSLPEFVRRCVEDVIEGNVGPPAMGGEDFQPVGVVELRELRPQASDHPGRMTAHGAAAAFGKDVLDVRRDPSYRAIDDTVSATDFGAGVATPRRKTQLELEAEAMDRSPIVRQNPFSKRGD